jgi:signal transduction histidine kinase
VIDTGFAATAEVSDDVRVLVDPEHLRRILVNYLVNADHHGAAPVRVTATFKGDTVEVCVRDSGAGVPADFVERLFTSFARADMSDRRGTGLGLSIVEGLADANGGTAFYDRSDGPCFGVRLRAG